MVQRSQQLDLFDVDDNFIVVFQSIITKRIIWRIKAMGLLVLLTMKIYANRDDGTCDLTQDQIGKILKIDPKTVKSAIQRLVKEGFVVANRDDDEKKETLTDDVRAWTEDPRGPGRWKILDVLPYRKRGELQKEGDVLLVPNSPKENKRQRQEIDVFRRTGHLPPGSNIIHIQGDINISIGELNINVGEMGPQEEEALVNKFGTFILDKIKEAKGLPK